MKASFWRAALGIVLAIWLSLNLAFRMKTQAVAFRGAPATAMETYRESSVELHPLSERYAYGIERSGVMPLRYRPLPFYVAWLCGSCILEGKVREDSPDRKDFPEAIVFESEFHNWATVSPAEVRARYPQVLSQMHEECAVFNAACLILALVTGAGAIATRQPRGPSKAL